VRSCSEQTVSDLEIVVVDDASTDATGIGPGGTRRTTAAVVVHPVNRGISPARATTVQHARGEWLVMLDSDWELLPHSLARLRAIIDELPPGVRMIRSRLEWDDGTVTPPLIPDGVTDYEGRLRWLEAVWRSGASSDAALHPP